MSMFYIVKEINEVIKRNPCGLVRLIMEFCILQMKSEEVILFGIEPLDHFLKRQFMISYPFIRQHE